LILGLPRLKDQRVEVAQLHCLISVTLYLLLPATAGPLVVAAQNIAEREVAGVLELFIAPVSAITIGEHYPEFICLPAYMDTSQLGQVFNISPFDVQIKSCIIYTPYKLLVAEVGIICP
jgi:hypothetical protein